MFSVLALEQVPTTCCGTACRPCSAFSKERLLSPGRRHAVGVTLCQGPRPRRGVLDPAPICSPLTLTFSPPGEREEWGPRCRTARTNLDSVTAHA